MNHGLKPKKRRKKPKYPSAPKQIVQGVLLGAAAIATSLGGCAPVNDSRSIDSAMDSGDLDGSVSTDDTSD